MDGGADMSDPNRLSQILVDLADTLVSDFDVVDFMTTLAHRLVELLVDGEAGVMLVDDSGRLHSVASSSETARMLDLFELQRDEGPCLDCFRSGEPIVNHSLSGSPARWALFEPEARRHGFAMVHALPMQLRGRMIGVVNIFSVEPVELDGADLQVGQALADIATIGLLQERNLREARLLNEQLQSALTSRVVIEQAKGVLAERLQLEMGDAFELLRSHARRHGQRLADIARAVITGELDTSLLSD